MPLNIKEEDIAIIQEIVEKNTFPGVRILKDIVDKLVLHHTALVYLPDEEISAFDIDTTYQEYKIKEISNHD